MPKLKTRKSVKKRIRLTAKGKAKRKHASTSHLLSGRSRKRKRKLRKPALLTDADLSRVKKSLPYG